VHVLLVFDSQNSRYLDEAFAESSLTFLYLSPFLFFFPARTFNDVFVRLFLVLDPRRECLPQLFFLAPRDSKISTNPPMVSRPFDSL